MSAGARDEQNLLDRDELSQKWVVDWRCFVSTYNNKNHRSYSFVVLLACEVASATIVLCKMYDCSTEDHVLGCIIDFPMVVLVAEWFVFLFCLAHVLVQQASTLLTLGSVLCVVQYCLAPHNWTLPQILKRHPPRHAYSVCCDVPHPTTHTQYTGQFCHSPAYSMSRPPSSIVLASPSPEEHALNATSYPINKAWKLVWPAVTYIAHQYKCSPTWAVPSTAQWRIWNSWPS